jgi:FXSXX-COOH protein
MDDRTGGDVRIESELLDLTDIDLDRLAGLPDSVLRASLRRVLSERVDLPQGYAGFENAM